MVGFIQDSTSVATYRSVGQENLQELSLVRCQQLVWILDLGFSILDCPVSTLKFPFSSFEFPSLPANGNREHPAIFLLILNDIPGSFVMLGPPPPIPHPPNPDFRLQVFSPSCLWNIALVGIFDFRL